MRPIFDVVSRFLGAGNLDEYTFDFMIKSLDQLLIVVLNSSGVEIQRVRGDDTTYLSGVTFDDDGGTVTLLADLPTDYDLFICLAPDEPVQSAEFKNKRNFKQDVIEAALDLLAGPIQRAIYLAKRSVRLHEADDEEEFSLILPPGMDELEEDSELIPFFTTEGWGDIADWIPVPDLQAAVVAAEESAASAAYSATQAAASASSAATASLSDGTAAASAANALTYAGQAATSASNAAGSATAAAASATAAAASAAAASTSQAAAVSAKNSADADVVLTHADVVLTHADVVLTHADVVLTHADVVLTHADVVSSGASVTAAAASAAAALVSEGNAAAAAAGAVPDISGTRGSPVAVVAANGIVFTATKYFNIHFLTGSGGAVDITKDPQIQAGTVVGQQLRCVGCSDTNTIKIEHGTGIRLRGGDGEAYLFSGTIMDFLWDGTEWTQVGV